MPIIYDMHVHLYEYSDSEIERILEYNRNLVVVAVSDDPESALRTVEISQSYPDRVVACIGFHPWNLREGGVDAAWESLRMAYRLAPRCIGEVGLDRRFLGEDTWPLQLNIFKRFVELAVEIDSFLNIHAPDAWKHAAGIIAQMGPVKAMLHWYTGPSTLVEAARQYGLYFSINSALRIQRKSLEAAKLIPLEYMVVESDGPYNYRGLTLNPSMVEDTIRIIAGLKGVEFEKAAEIIEGNSRKLLDM